ncbi:MAG TPA: hypothetical protein VF331_19740 [Polyangiales bacterium]
MRSATRSVRWLLLALAVSACAGSDPYGHGREYFAADGEDSYLEKARDVSYEDVRRDPMSFDKQLVGWFGVVTSVEKKPDGQAKVGLELRFHQPRHLCSDQFESSCRVTISERAGGPFSTVLKLKPQDAAGSDQLNIGSLVKVYGTPNGEFDERGGPMITAQWYRQWPHGAYVTTTGHVTMRR